MRTHDPRDYLPDIRDGLTHRERVVLQCLYDLQQERGGRNVPTGMLYGTVVEHVDMSIEEMQIAHACSLPDQEERPAHVVQLLKVSWRTLKRALEY